MIGFAQYFAICPVDSVAGLGGRAAGRWSEGGRPLTRAEKTSSQSAGTTTAASPGDGRHRRAEQRRAATRKHLIATARTLVSERGLATATLEHIAAAAGVLRATIYLHFVTKADVLKAAFTKERRDSPDDRSRPRKQAMRCRANVPMGSLRARFSDARAITASDHRISTG
ncbi:MAG: TetR family transcriptional regulator [Myxococcales bacterium]|nr:TetR family transcriptional regulator [Myxococcales bacterium]